MPSKLLLSFLILALSGCCGIFTSASQQPLALHTDRRSSASMLMDSSLEVSLQAKLQSLELDQPSNIYVKSFNRHILVLGQAGSEENIEKITEIIAQTDGVKKVYNEVSPSAPLTYWQKAKDRWITAKITSSMMLTPKMEAWKIHVTTENAVVYLVGIVTPEEEQFAVDVAKNVSGVRKVVKLFDYKKPSCDKKG